MNKKQKKLTKIHTKTGKNRGKRLKIGKKSRKMLEKLAKNLQKQAKMEEKASKICGKTSKNGKKWRKTHFSRVSEFFLKISHFTMGEGEGEGVRR